MVIRVSAGINKYNLLFFYALCNATSNIFNAYFQLPTVAIFSLKWQMAHKTVYSHYKRKSASKNKNTTEI